MKDSPNIKSLNSQINVLTARFAQMEKQAKYSVEKIKAFQAPITRQLEKLKAERDNLLASDCETVCETIIPAAE